MGANLCLTLCLPVSASVFLSISFSPTEEGTSMENEMNGWQGQ